ncbi:MAG: HD domain-containing phosphohydrolase, partial [candidate division NC10 bacterium]
METNDLKILAIDDNRDNLTVLKAVVLDRLPGTRLLTALDGPKGLELARAEDPDVILLDIVMPGMDGFEVCRRLKAGERLQAIPVVFLTALSTDRESRVKALEVGAEGFLSKPFDEVELTAQIRAMAKIKAANHLQRMEREQLEKLIAERTRELEQELAERQRVEEALRETLERLRRVTGSVINVIVMAVETRDPYTAGHQKRVGDLAWAIAGEMGLPPEQVEGIRIAGVIHDLGKISIPSEILNMPRKLSEIEYGLIKTHSQKGYDILKEVEFDWPIARIIHQHHERLDGSGYPQGLKG